MKEKNSIDKVKDYLKRVLPKERYEHTLRVGDLALDMAKAYNVDTDKAYLAGTSHDIAKKREEELLKKYDISFFADEEDIERFFPIIHSPLGAMELREVFGVEDEDIFRAICYHTTGRPAMSMLEKIVFLADSAEAGRKSEISDKIREMAYEDIDKALVMTMDLSIDKCLERSRAIHPLTVEARNYYL